MTLSVNRAILNPCLPLLLPGGISLPFMETINKNFGLVVAYLLPGFIGLGGVALLVPAVASWIAPVPDGAGLGLGPPVYAVLSAIAAGMVFSCVRWLVLDQLLHWCGLTPPAWNFERLKQQLDVFNYLVEYHYRYYQFYGNTIVALLWTYLLNRTLADAPYLGVGTDVGVIVISVVLLAGARDSLSKYYNRTMHLIGHGAGKNVHAERSAANFPVSRPSARRSTSRRASHASTREIRRPRVDASNTLQR